MRVLAAAVAGAAALTVMIPSVPWERIGCPPEDCSFSEEWIPPLQLALGLLLYLAIPASLLTAMLVGILAIRDRRPTVGMRVAAMRGLRDGGIAVGAAYVLAGLAQVTVALVSGWPPVDDVGQSWLTRLLEAGIVLGTLVLAHVVRSAITSRAEVRPATPA